MKKKILSVLLSGALIFSVGCGQAQTKQEDPSGLDEEYSEEEYDDEEYEDAEEELSVDSVTAALDSFLSMSVDGSSGTMTISRQEAKNEPMGDPGTWTIFVYLCGTDLESGGGYASGDLVQMLEASTDENIKFLIQTGGTSQWMNDYYDASADERWLVTNGDYMELVDTAPPNNMGDPETLADFLTWGVENYPAEKMGVILWDHGSGSINGVCFDENYNADSLTLPELNQAFSTAYDQMTDQFEFIGFDCCLMGTLETANVCSTYARYFFGSQEIEPGTGWDYSTIGTYLTENPDITGAELGEITTDSFYEECAVGNEESGCTFTIVDCSKVDDLLVAFNDFSRELYEATQRNEVSGVVRGIYDADNFGGNNKAEGYTNMVDLGGIIQNCSDYADGSAVLTALQDCIVYNKNGSDHPYASGLSIYYPLEIQGSNEIGMFADICPSPYYLSLVDMVARGYSEDGYSNVGLFDEEGNWSADDFDTGYEDDYFEYEESNGESQLITFEVPPTCDEDGSYYFVLDERGLEYAAMVSSFIFLDVDGVLLEIGETDDIQGDWETGYFADNFDGYWLALSDGSLMPTYIAEQTEEYTVLTTPILLNGRRANLRVRQYLDYSLVVEGAWDGIDENGYAAREITEIVAGDEICPIYTLEDESEFEGDPYIWTGGEDMTYTLLPSGDYYYAFMIDDVYGDFYVSDPVLFTIDEEGGMTYTSLEE